LKEKAWYYEDVQIANLPTSFISEEARQAGEEFEHRQSKATKVKKSIAPKPQRSRRGRKPAFDPTKGFPISARAAQQLITGGFVKDERQVAAVKHRDTVSSDPSLMPQVARGASSRPGSDLIEPPQPQYPTPGPQVNFIYSQQPVSVAEHDQPIESFGSDTLPDSHSRVQFCRG